MFGSLFKSVADLASDVIEVVTTPVEIVADLASAVTKPIAEGLRAAANDVKSLKD